MGGEVWPQCQAFSKEEDRFVTLQIKGRIDCLLAAAGKSMAKKGSLSARAKTVEKKKATGKATEKATEKVSASPLHPSWEASRRRKEQEGAKFQGERIVFSD